jgi:hypothetical protein
VAISQFLVRIIQKKSTSEKQQIRTHSAHQEAASCAMASHVVHAQSPLVLDPKNLYAESG